MNARRYYKEIRVQQFRALVEVGRLSSFTAAALALSLSRAAVWQQVHALEDEFGTDLVVTDGHHTELTADGLLLIDLVGPLVEGFDSVKETFLDRRNKLERYLRVATTASLLNHELRKPVAIFRRKHPDVSVSLSERPSSAALELMMRGQADVAVIGRGTREFKNENLKTESLTQYPFVMACPKGHVLARAKRFDLNALIRHPVLFASQGTNARQRIDAVLAVAKLEGRIDLAFESQNAALLLTYVEEGLGVALSSMSPELIAKYQGKLAFRDVSEHFGTEEILLVQRQRRCELSHVTAFIDIVRKEVRSGSQR